MSDLALEPIGSIAQRRGPQLRRPGQTPDRITFVSIQSHSSCSDDKHHLHTVAAERGFALNPFCRSPCPACRRSQRPSAYQISVSWSAWMVCLCPWPLSAPDLTVSGQSNATLNPCRFKPRYAKQGLILLPLTSLPSLGSVYRSFVSPQVGLDG
jgi:hypothetical protein